jgi:signal peptidase I
MPKPHSAPAPTASPPAAVPAEKIRGAAWRNLGKQLLPLIVAFVAIKGWIADVYAIPSGSMEPTLHGREYSGDRIFCVKFPFYWRQPQRWEVFVFKFPYAESRRYTQENTKQYDGEYFIKRCVGLPGEEILMARGDLYVRRGAGNAQRQVKDDATQRGMWLPVWRGDFAQMRLDEMAVYWSSSGAAQVKERTLTAPPGVTTTFTYRPQTRLGSLDGIPDRYVRRQFVDYRCSRCGRERRQTVTYPQFAVRCNGCEKIITETEVTYYDFRLDYPVRDAAAILSTTQVGDAAISRQSDWHWVPDLRLSAQANFRTPTAELTLNLSNNLDTATFTLSAQADGAATAKLVINRELVATAAVPLTRGGAAEHAVEFYLCDGEYRAFVEGKLIFAQAPRGLELRDLPPVTRSGAEVSLRDVSLTDLALDRDIYYFSPLRESFRVPADGYMGVGDNCPASNDSRNWGPVPAKNLVGVAKAVWWPLTAARLIW